MSLFKENLAIVEKDRKKICIDKNGTKIFEADYDFITSFNENLAAVMTGKVIETSMLRGETEEELIKRYKKSQREHQLWGFINKSGKLVIKVEYESVSPFSEGISIVIKDGKEIYIDKNGNIPFETNFDTLGVFHDGVACVKKDNKYGFIDIEGKVIIPLIYNSLSYFKNGYAVVKKDNKYGVIDKLQNVIIPFEYDLINSFNKNFATAKKDGKWGILEIRRILSCKNYHFYLH